MKLRTSGKADLNRGVAGTLPDLGSRTMSSTMSMRRSWSTEFTDRFPPTCFIRVDDLIPCMLSPTAWSRGYNGKHWSRGCNIKHWSRSRNRSQNTLKIVASCVPRQPYTGKKEKLNWFTSITVWKVLWTCSREQLAESDTTTCIITWNPIYCVLWKGINKFCKL